LLQESTDGSIEAWGVDPEPIRGGKFILQARKNNHAVPAAAVKELYGSMMHEGANKGILVTTSDFAAESYDFARNKPIILLNGSQLISLFEKHGVPARISFREAISLKSWLS
jgi:restriction system protein